MWDGEDRNAPGRARGLKFAGVLRVAHIKNRSFPCGNGG